jgi:hypothetical protein
MSMGKGSLWRWMVDSNKGSGWIFSIIVVVLWKILEEVGVFFIFSACGIWMLWEMLWLDCWVEALNPFFLLLLFIKLIVVSDLLLRIVSWCCYRGPWRLRYLNIFCSPVLWGLEDGTGLRIGANTSILGSFRVCGVGYVRVFNGCPIWKEANLSSNSFYLFGVVSPSHGAFSSKSTWKEKLHPQVGV